MIIMTTIRSSAAHSDHGFVVTNNSRLRRHINARATTFRRSAQPRGANNKAMTRPGLIPRRQ
jgi:hypothetical protein